jgi:hypothetical protein
MNDVESLISTPISVGELFDKISVLVVKRKKIESEEKLKHIAKEYDLLYPLCYKYIEKKQELKEALDKLILINENLWDILEAQRQMEKAKELGEPFVTASISVYRVNDERFRLKQLINDLTNSAIKEQKYYTGK